MATKNPTTAEATRFDIADEGFEVKLPPGWRKLARDTDAPERFRSRDDAHQLTVTSFQSDVLMDGRKRGETLSALVEHRRSAERRGMGEQMVVSAPSTGEDGGVVFARYSGTDVQAGHRFATMITVSGKGAWAFFLEGPDGPDTEASFRALTEQIFGTIVLRN